MKRWYISKRVVSLESSRQGREWPYIGYFMYNYRPSDGSIIQRSPYIESYGKALRVLPDGCFVGVDGEVIL